MKADAIVGRKLKATSTAIREPGPNVSRGKVRGDGQRLECARGLRKRASLLAMSRSERKKRGADGERAFVCCG